MPCKWGSATGYKAGCRCAECRDAKRIEMREYVAKVRARDGISPTQKYRPGVTRMAAGSCTRCGKAIRSRAAEPMCRVCRYRAKRGIEISAADRLAIYERDGWVCGICSELVDRALTGHDQFGPTLDHIQPRSLGGSDDPENLRLAHRACNSARGNRAA